MKTNIKKTTIIFLALNVLIGVIVIVILIKNSDRYFIKNILRDDSEIFFYTSPILDCEDISQGGTSVVSYEQFNKTAEQLSKKYQISNFSIYFRDLNNGPWVGINEKEFFSPASLMKTPILMSFLKQVERNPELIKKEAVATEEYFDYSIKQNFDLKTSIVKGQKYTLEEIARLMITESDNVATLMLSKYVDQDDYNNLLRAVGLVVEEKGKDVDVQVKDFAGFFRILYNSSYLNRNSSEDALKLFSQSTFASGIVAGVPKGTVVAHKYGERSLEQKQDGVIVTKEKQLHDCGIVYAKTSPYILCVMTRGKDFAKQESFISEVSKFVYNQVSK